MSAAFTMSATSLRKPRKLDVGREPGRPDLFLERSARRPFAHEHEVCVRNAIKHLRQRSQHGSESLLGDDPPGRDEQHVVVGDA